MEPLSGARCSLPPGPHMRLPLRLQSQHTPNGLVMNDEIPAAHIDRSVPGCEIAWTTKETP